MRELIADSRAQGFRTPPGLRLLTLAIGVAGAVLVKARDIEKIKPTPTAPTRFEYLQAHPESLLYSAVLTLWLVAAVFYIQHVHKRGGVE